MREHTSLDHLVIQLSPHMPPILYKTAQHQLAPLISKAILPSHCPYPSQGQLVNPGQAHTHMRTHLLPASSLNPPVSNQSLYLMIVHCCCAPARSASQCWKAAPRCAGAPGRPPAAPLWASAGACACGGAPRCACTPPRAARSCRMDALCLPASSPAGGGQRQHGWCLHDSFRQVSAGAQGSIGQCQPRQPGACKATSPYLTAAARCLRDSLTIPPSPPSPYITATAWCLQDSLTIPPLPSLPHHPHHTSQPQPGAHKTPLPYLTVPPSPYLTAAA
eukprot:1156319-Pelagomonas_calceolata.AAC.25